MEPIKTPLAIYLLWHKDCQNKEVIDYCFSKLQSNIKKPFSRGINIPVFFRTGTSISNKPISLDIHRAEKTAIFIFIDTKMVIDKEWGEYLGDLYEQWKTSQTVLLCPVSLDNTAYNIDSPINTINYIRYHEMEEKEKNHLLFIHMVNEICRFIHNQSEYVVGGQQEKAKPVKLFLSHTKRDERAVDLGQKIKDRIDNTSLKRFFDAYDIPPAHDFKDEIEEQLADSTIISIHTDSYSSRPWCQKEIILAKKYHRPMVIVDFLESYEDRRFPYIANAPAFHITPDKEDFRQDILKILEISMMETLRFTYCKLYLTHLQEVGLAPKDCKLLCHPPELNELQVDNAVQFLYPDPPVEHDEGEMLSLTKKKCITPLTWRNMNLKGLEAGISVSEPDEEELLYSGFFKEHINLALYEISRHLLVRIAHLSYGGDLRPGGFTNFLFEIAACQKQKLKDEYIKVTNYQFWPTYNKKDNDEWIARNFQLADFKRIDPPGDIQRELEIDTFVPPDSVIHKYYWARSLTRMRKEMIRASDARICIGGRTSGYKGKLPGVLEEILLAMEVNKPLYLNGCFGGVTGGVIGLLRGDENEAFTYGWQVKQSPPYAELVHYFNEHKPPEESAIDYEKIQQTITGYTIEKIAEHNGLSIEENNRLFDTDNVFELIRLILKGLNAVKEKK